MLVKQASELLDTAHPLHATLCKWCIAQRKMSKGDVPTKRMARKWLAVYPVYRHADYALEAA